jgi:hypothetical protein
MTGIVLANSYFTLVGIGFFMGTWLSEKTLRHLIDIAEVHPFSLQKKTSLFSICYCFALLL